MAHNDPKLITPEQILAAAKFIEDNKDELRRIIAESGLFRVNGGRIELNHGPRETLPLTANQPAHQHVHQPPHQPLNSNHHEYPPSPPFNNSTQLAYQSLPPFIPIQSTCQPTTPTQPAYESSVLLNPTRPAFQSLNSTQPAHQQPSLLTTPQPQQSNSSHLPNGHHATQNGINHSSNYSTNAFNQPIQPVQTPSQPTSILQPPFIQHPSVQPSIQSPSAHPLSVQPPSVQPPFIQHPSAHHFSVQPSSSTQSSSFQAPSVLCSSTNPPSPSSISSPSIQPLQPPLTSSTHAASLESTSALPSIPPLKNHNNEVEREEKEDEKKEIKKDSNDETLPGLMQRKLKLDSPPFSSVSSPYSSLSLSHTSPLNNNANISNTTTTSSTTTPEEKKEEDEGINSRGETQRPSNVTKNNTSQSLTITPAPPPASQSKMSANAPSYYNTATWPNAPPFYNVPNMAAPFYNLPVIAYHQPGYYPCQPSQLFVPPPPPYMDPRFMAPPFRHPGYQYPSPAPPHPHLPRVRQPVPISLPTFSPPSEAPPHAITTSNLPTALTSQPLLLPKETSPRLPLVPLSLPSNPLFAPVGPSSLSRGLSNADREFRLVFSSSHTPHDSQVIDKLVFVDKGDHGSVVSVSRGKMALWGVDDQDTGVVYKHSMVDEKFVLYDIDYAVTSDLLISINNQMFGVYFQSYNEQFRTKSIIVTDEETQQLLSLQERNDSRTTVAFSTKSQILIHDAKNSNASPSQTFSTPSPPSCLGKGQSLIMSGHQNGQLILWDLRGPNQEMCSLQSRALPVVGCHMLDDNCVISSSGSFVVEWDRRNVAQPIREVLLSPSPILVSKASIDGKVAFSTAEGLYLMDKNRVSIRQLSSLSIFRDMAWSPAESLFVSTAEGSIQVFSGPNNSFLILYVINSPRYYDKPYRMKYKKNARPGDR